MLGESETPRALARDWRSADLPAADRAMLEYAVKLTRTPARVGVEDVARLREVGFSETAVLDIAQVAAYYNYVNRLADGLGVELEPFWSEEDLTVTPEEFEARTGHAPPPAGDGSAVGPSPSHGAPPPEPAS